MTCEICEALQEAIDGPEMFILDPDNGRPISRRLFVGFILRGHKEAKHKSGGVYLN